jgi:hypothetical protein
MLGWYDGLTSGMARCRTCGRTYHVEMVAWDHENRIRVFGLREVSRFSYEIIERLNAVSVTGNQVSEHANAIALLVRDALATSFERTLFVVSEDLCTTILAAKVISFSEWVPIIGL